ncbi:TrmH family RNA methyltransferase [Fodinicola feengrottensis]|uniref:TrmH family RNA methyltransferase n=1 Tax=Fodinicola feengrottensis TaxID=435914 RepID=UPI00244252B4|nr:RNA methyltransferase [Fodinicola feengrottensis]
MYGRKPVIEALRDQRLTVDKVLLAQQARGESVTDILAAAKAANVPVRRVDADRIKRLAGNGKQDQGVLADVLAPKMRTLAAALNESYREQPRKLLLLDGITTPANVGMIIRAATAAGIDGIIIPRHGVASLGPLVVKASAGIVFRAPLLRCGSAVEAAESLTEAGYVLVGLDSDGAESLFHAEFGERMVFVLGGETHGLGAEVRPYVGRWVRIPMAGDVESLNVSTAAAVVSFELLRREKGAAPQVNVG